MLKMKPVAAKSISIIKTKYSIKNLPSANPNGKEDTAYRDIR